MSRRRLTQDDGVGVDAVVRWKLKLLDIILDIFWFVCVVMLFINLDFVGSTEFVGDGQCLCGWD